MSSDQGALTLTRECRKCGADIPWDGGPGRPRVVCDACRPPQWAPLRGRRINQSVSGQSEPLTRRTDPETSRMAAESIPAGAVETRILEAFDQFGWLNSSEVANVLEDAHEPTVVTAVSRLVGSGALVKTGTTRPSNRGRASIVYKLADA